MTVSPFGEVQKYLYKGDNRTYRLSVVDKDSNPVDISADLIKFTAKVNATDTTAVIYKTSADAAEIERPSPGGSTNQADIKIIPADTINVDPGELVFDVEITRAVSSKVHTVVKGTLTLEQDVTN